ncbi:hypothetical protein [Alienimonas californiensis]|nr:hypothetical protein [Alienimonas californiensis]
MFSDPVAKRTGDGWKATWRPHSGGGLIFVRDESDQDLAFVRLHEVLPRYGRFAHPTTAGTDWQDHSLVYFTADGDRFVARAWWGARVAISLVDLKPIDPGEFADELDDREREIVRRELSRLVTWAQESDSWLNDDLSTEETLFSVGTLVHFPGLLGMTEAIPQLRLLESGESFKDIFYGQYDYRRYFIRRLAQTALRRLGEKAGLYRQTAPFSAQSRFPFDPPEPQDGPTRHAELQSVRSGDGIAEVYRRLGPPDETNENCQVSGRISLREIVRRGKQFWRYDVDADPPYTALVWFDANDRVVRAVLYDPPFWTSPDVFPSDRQSVLGSLGRTTLAFLDQLDDGTFAGSTIERPAAGP